MKSITRSLLHRPRWPAADRRRARAGHQGTQHQVRVPEPEGPPAGRRRAEVRRPRRAEVRQQDPGQAVPGRHARRRPANRLGAAGRHDRDDGAQRRHPVVAGQGLRGVRLSVPVRHTAGGRRGGRRSVRQGLVRQARREEPDRPWVLGARLSQPDQQQAPDHEDGRHRRAEDPRDPEPDLHRHVQRARRRGHADALPRAVHGARAEGGRRSGKPLHADPHVEVLRGAEAPGRDAPRLQPAGGADRQEAVGSAKRGGEEDRSRLRDKKRRSTSASCHASNPTKRSPS